MFNIKILKTKKKNKKNKLNLLINKIYSHKQKIQFFLIQNY